MAAPKYVQTQRSAHQTVSAANTNRDGTGTTPDLIAGAAGGTVVKRIRITATGTTTDGMIRLFKYDGSSSKLIGEIPVQGVVPSATRQAWQYSGPIPGGPVELPSASHVLRGSTHNAETFHVVVEGGDYA